MYGVWLDFCSPLQSVSQSPTESCSTHHHSTDTWCIVILFESEDAESRSQKPYEHDTNLIYTSEKAEIIYFVIPCRFLEPLIIF